jgi:Secretion system C-terminal sorting domain
VQQHTELAYAYILTNNQVGAPCVFYPDYYGTVIPNAPVNNFKTRINNLVALHKTYIYGSADVDYLSRNGTPYYQSFLGGYADRTVIYQLQPNGTGKDVVVAINFSSAALDVYQELNDTWGAISTGTQFTDMLGYSTGGTVTSVVGPPGQPQLHIQLPGHSYTVFVEGVNTPLPVQLVDFQAYESGDDVQLSWSAATERNFDTYEIERSVGDNLNFVTIGREAGKNDGTSQSYTYSDKKAPVNTPLYYRLNMKDADGSSAYSSIEKAELVRKSFSAAVAPNPATEQATVLLSVQHAQDFTITVVNTLGQTIFVQHAATDSGDYTFELPDLPSGLYRIVVSGATEQTVLSLVKK